MLFRPVPTDPDQDLGPDPGQQAEDALLYRDTLHELIGIGTDLARLTHQQAVAQAQAAAQGAAPAAPLEGHVTAFDRTARAIRRCITLARSLHEPPPPARAPAPPRAAARTSAPHGAGQDAAGHPHPATPGRDSGADLRDRPEAPDRDGPDRDEDDTNRPVAAVIADICRDLGLNAPPGAHSWERHTPEDTAPLHARAEALSGTHKPGPGPHDPRPSAAQHLLDPRPNQPAATPGAQPTPIHSGATHTDSIPPDDPAEAVAAVLRHATHARWRPPPES